MDGRTYNDGLDTASRESLKTAIENGDMSAVQKHLQTGGNVNAFLDNDNNTLLHLAVAARKLDIVQLLVTAPGINLKALNIDGQSPSQIALQEKANKNKKGLSYKEEIIVLKNELSALKKSDAGKDELIAAEKNLAEKEAVFEVNTDVMGQFSRIYRTLEDAKSPSAAPAAPGNNASEQSASQVKLPFFLNDQQKKMKKSIDMLSKAGEEIAALHQKLKSCSPEDTPKIQRGLMAMLDRFAKEKSNIMQDIAEWTGSLKTDSAGNYKKSDKEAVGVIRAYFNQEVVNKYSFLDPLREGLGLEQKPAAGQREEIQPIKASSSAPGKLQSSPAPTPDAPRTKLGSLAAEPAKPTIKISLAHPRGVPNTAPPPPPSGEAPNPEALRRSKEAGQRKTIEQKQPNAGQSKPADLSTIRDAFNKEFLNDDPRPKKPGLG